MLPSSNVPALVLGVVDVSLLTDNARDYSEGRAFMFTFMGSALRFRVLIMILVENSLLLNSLHILRPMGFIYRRRAEVVL